MKIHAMVIISILLLFMGFDEAYSIEADVTNGKLYYSGEYSKLEGYGSALAGWTLKDKEITSAASRGGFNLSWGTEWYERFSLDVYSSNSMIPGQIGQGPSREMSLNSITAFLGQTEDLTLKISRTEFYGIGVVDGTVDLYKNGILLAEGEEFNTGIAFDTLQLGKSYKHEGSFLGIGIARMQLLGVEENWASAWTGPTSGKVEEQVDGYGAVVTIDLKFSSEISPTFSYAFIIGGDVIATDIAGLVKAGYGIGVKNQIAKDICISINFNGYFWYIRNWIMEFEAASTDVGYSSGLQFEWAW